MNVYSLISLIISILALVVAIVTTLISIKQFRKTREEQFYNLVYECVKPLSTFIYDALLCKDTGRFVDTKLIDEAEKSLFANFESLYSYGVHRKLVYLRQFATLRISEVDYPALENSMSFFHILSFYEDEYIKFRHNNIDRTVSCEAMALLQRYINTFRKLLVIQSKYTISVLYKTKYTVHRKSLINYYNQLFSFLSDGKLEKYNQSAEQYEINTNKKWYRLCEEHKMDGIDDD